MAEDPKSKLFRQILQRNSDRVLLERMKLHGFWPQHLDLPPDPPDEAAERQQLEQEMSTLQAQHASIVDPERALAQERKRRWEESKQRRAEKKLEREAKQQARHEADQEHRRTNLVHAGVGVSGGLNQDQSDLSKLEGAGLPVLYRAQDVADRLGITLGTLRWLTYHRRNAALVHYHRYTIGKKSGGRRSISAPKSALKRAQHWVLANILEKMEVAATAHGFVKHRSIVTNAAPHVRQPVVINMDLQDFFPTLTFHRVKGLFGSFGYSEQVATVLSLICTEPPRAKVELRGKVYFVALGERVLPQGASTSPAITNLVCLRLDRRLGGLAGAFDAQYSRYADDLTFSGDLASGAVGRLLRLAGQVVEEEGFIVHSRKTRVMRRGSRQTVTGVVVNDRVTTSRKEVRALRALLHNAKKHGLQSQNRDNRDDFLQHLQGKIAFVCMVDPQKGAPLRKAFFELFDH